ncbi:hypothetical protein ABH999_006582 [Bradyrhizobium yuanmingense]|uniref:hypothetical protein n=1 Tax=Bradyrhizobium yuanmingense TaxID=108015 RepID=UPI0035124539
MIRLFRAAFAVLFCCALLVALLVPVAVAAEASGTVTWSYGEWISQWAGALGTVLAAVAMWALRLLPGQIYAVLVAARADQIIQKGIDYGIAMAVGASKDNALTVNIGNDVLAQALQYVVDHAPGWLQAWMGGPEQIAQKIVARLNLVPEASPSIEAALAVIPPSKR